VLDRHQLQCSGKKTCWSYQPVSIFVALHHVTHDKFDRPIGLRGLDIRVENDHVVLAVGRDFSNVSQVDGIVDGIIVGSRKRKLAVAVDVLLLQ
jgi:hypothetical protein